MLVCTVLPIFIFKEKNFLKIYIYNLCTLLLLMKTMCEKCQ